VGNMYESEVSSLQLIKIKDISMRFG